ncbi:transmembrane protein 135-like [Dermatophagoides pteronyssinus]|uniref:transmembrane protein 135-like n=1 Tax=Dermatophagoides pteronyssinus TaxID=6956 RepID=UPI003F674444
MPSILSKFFSTEWNVPYNCYEMGHGWTPYCSAAALEIGLIVFQQSLKLYAPLYLGQTILQKKLNQKNFQECLRSIIRSSSFLGANAFLAILFLCLSLNLSGRFYYPLNAYIPSFFGSFLAILIERPSRRKALAFYVSNIATEITYKILLTRNYIGGMKNGKFFIFSMAITVLLFLYENNQLNDPLICFILQLVIGKRTSSTVKPEEQSKKPNDNDAEAIEFDAEKTIKKKNLWNQLQNRTNQIWLQLKNQFPILAYRNPSCYHHLSYSCLENILLQNFLKTFTIGWFSQLGLRFVQRLMAGRLNDAISVFHFDQLLSSKYLSFALFLSTFSSVYNSTLCFSNCFHKNNENFNQKWSTILASTLASLSTIRLASDQSMILYLFWKSIEALFNVGVKQGYITNERFWIIFIYSVSCSQIFYSAILEPKQMKPSYKRFLDQISQNRLRYINRNVLEVFGTNASNGYDYFLPLYDLRFTSRKFQESVLIWLF